MSSKEKNAQTMKLFHQIALKNVKNNLKNYMIYFLTLTLSVALFYTFNSIRAQFSMMNIEDEGSYLSFATGAVLAVSLFICVVMGFLVSYANRFLMRKRKKELGIYITLGIDQKMISKLIQRETFFIGVFSLAAGLLVGVFLSQGLSVISMRMLNAAGSSYHFVFSPFAAIGAICFFSLLFVVMYRANNRALKKYKLIDLLYAEKKNEGFKERGLVTNVLIAAAGTLAVLAGYLMILKPAAISTALAAAGVAFLTAGTFLLFWSASGIVLRACKKNKKWYYHGLNLFSIAQITSKLKSTNVSLSVICLLLFLSICSMTAGLGMGKSISRDLGSRTPYDATISKSDIADSSWQEERRFVGYLKEKGIAMERIGTFGQLSVFQQEGAEIEGEELNVIALSDYNLARNMQGLAPVSLSGTKFLLSSTDPGNKDRLKNFVSKKDAQLQINGVKLTSQKTNILESAYFDKNVNFGDAAVVVPDDAVKGLTPVIVRLNINYRGDKEKADSILADEIFGLQDTNISVATKNEIIVEVTSTNLMFSYIAAYLGITFMICACVVLALHHMGESEENKKRYAALKRMGIPVAAIRKSALQQIGVHFGFPLLLAVFHAAVITAGIYLRMTPIGALAVIYNIFLAAFVTAVIYGSYFFLTYLSGKAAAEE